MSGAWGSGMARGHGSLSASWPRGLSNRWPWLSRKRPVPRAAAQVRLGCRSLNRPGFSGGRVLPAAAAAGRQFDGSTRSRTRQEGRSRWPSFAILLALGMGPVAALAAIREARLIAAIYSAGDAVVVAPGDRHPCRGCPPSARRGLGVLPGPPHRRRAHHRRDPPGGGRRSSAVCLNPRGWWVGPEGAPGRLPEAPATAREQALKCTN